MDAMTVSPAVPGEAVAIAGLLRELDEFYDAPFREPVEEKVASITGVLFGDPARLCHRGEGRPGARGNRLLLVCLAGYVIDEVAVPQGAVRAAGPSRLGSGPAPDGGAGRDRHRGPVQQLEWTTDRGNHDARAFYERLGVPPLESKVFYRAEGQALRAIANGGDRT